MADIQDILDLGQDNSVSSVDMLRKNFKAGMDSDGRIVVVYKTNGGKGSGPQTIPATELLQFSQTLAECAARGEGEAHEAGYIPTYELLARSFRLVANPGPTIKSNGNVTPAPFGGRDWYEWNSSTGQGTASKGSKPAKVPVNEMDDVVSLFHESTDRMIAKLVEAGHMEEPYTDEDESLVDLDGIESDEG